MINRPLILYFNPRPPCGVRPNSPLPDDGSSEISIHAPLAGCDGASIVACCGNVYFNPRPPCGVRRATSPTACIPRMHFNPRPPCGVRPQARKWYNWLIVFQSTPPLRGATTCWAFIFWMVIYFNPRPPCGVRLADPRWAVSMMRFQSTPPLRGATMLWEIRKSPAHLFQSTPPLRGATGL